MREPAAPRSPGQGVDLDGAPTERSRVTAPAAVLRLSAACPYLVAADEAWRSAAPDPEHRCTAVAPPAPIAPAKQHRLCLDERHLTCATFLAARGELGVPSTSDGEAAVLHRVAADGPTRWRFAGTTPVVLERSAGLGVLFRAWGRVGQAALVGLIAIAFGVLVLARSTTGRLDVASPAPSSSAPAASRPAASPTPSPSPTPAPSLTPTPALSPSPSPTPTPSAPTSYRTYRVQSGDTLVAIAARFGTTVKAIAELNGIADPSRIRVGQVLRIP